MSPWLQTGIGITVGYVLWKYVLQARLEVETPALGAYSPNAYKRKKSPWKRKTAMRVGEREKMRKRAPGCFLKPPTGYPVCPKGGTVTCDGLLSARKRAIMNKDLPIRKRAESIALAKGCGWAMRSKALVV
jgi:hypothetical protein